MILGRFLWVSKSWSQLVLKTGTKNLEFKETNNVCKNLDQQWFMNNLNVFKHRIRCFGLRRSFLDYKLDS